MRNARWIGLSAVCLLLSCAGSPEPVRTAPIRLESALHLSEYVARDVEIQGHISTTIWQHLTGYFPDRPHSYYFDVGDTQIMIYAAAPIGCEGEIRVRGRVVELRGPSKRPEETRHAKVDNSYAEYHILVDEWSCLGPA